MTAKSWKNYALNRVLAILTMTDFAIVFAWGLTGPFAAIFFSERIADGSVLVAGTAGAIFFLCQSIPQIPIGLAVDKRKGEVDDFWALFLGTILMTATPFMLSVSTISWQIYIAQAIGGFGMAVSSPARNAIFDRHLDKGKFAYEFGVSETTVSIAAALSSYLGALAIEFLGYRFTFFIVGLITFFAGVGILGIYRFLKKSS